MGKGGKGRERKEIKEKRREKEGGGKEGRTT
jgi:hypothetical protein